MEFSNRIEKMQSSPIRRLIPFAEQAKASGKEVLHLNIGQPDIETPREFFASIEKNAGKVVPYSHSAGIIELRKAFSKYYEKWNCNITPEEIIITNGGSEAIIFAMGAVADPGDEIVVIEPFYANYRSFAGMLNLNLLPVSADPEAGYMVPDLSEYDSKITDKTKAIIFSNPCNPTGAVYPKEDVLRILEFARKHDLYVIADEVYREFTFDGLKPFSAMEFEAYHDRLILIDSVSKRYSACGARVGLFATKSKELFNHVMKMAQARLCPPMIAQLGSLGFLELGSTYLDGIRDEYQRRRDIVYNELSKVEGLYFKEPKGAFYLAVKLPIDNSEKFVKWMLTDFDIDGTTTMVAPLDGFYGTPGKGEQEIRIAYVLEEKRLLQACEILRQGLERYMKKAA
ncbi:MAG TPA: pyridoxal phosphate-dependent aminotransferase [Thermotogota bacterium]|nr:pyridoxal phosphate-dependent aminotransferase [Thermotogota bacterium]HPJ89137.1 pyridoxal phosphate-dependent aminotransferase [Thermotogota bacterium]HPR96757.1 pyridoxal phosphate-dependent aminotransferase [Thermotogota bacterium]